MLEITQTRVRTINTIVKEMVDIVTMGRKLRHIKQGKHNTNFSHCFRKKD